MSAGKTRRLAFSFEEVGRSDAVNLGGKGAGMCLMARHGFPTPPGFILVTGTSRSHMQHGKSPKRVGWQFSREIMKLERKTGRKLGDVRRPLLVSVRSGAKVSMPGMMDTVLNLGLNEGTLAGLIEETGDEAFALGTYCRFLFGYGTTVRGIKAEHFEKKGTVDHKLDAAKLRSLAAKYEHVIKEWSGRPVPDSPIEQLHEAVEAVFRSWNSERARSFRQFHKIPNWWGTAALVQAMVFGNANNDSGTGVVFSRNVESGDPGLCGEILWQAQGEDLVSGRRTPESIETLKETHPDLYEELAWYVDELELLYRDAVDVEFTIERGQLHLLQVRRAKRTIVAAIRIAVDLVNEGRATRQEVVSRVSEDDLKQLERLQFVPESLQAASSNQLLKGMAASGGAGVGQAVFNRHRAIRYHENGYPVVLVTRDTTPDDFPGMCIAKAIVTATGGQTCHAALTARSLGRPAVVGADCLDVCDDRATVGKVVIREGDWLSVDGTDGVVYRGQIDLSTSKSDDEKVKTFLGWFDERPIKRHVDFSLSSNRYSMNQFLLDYYILRALERVVEGETATRAQELLSRIRHDISEVFVTYLVLAVSGESRHTWSHCYNPGELAEELQDLKRWFGGKRNMDRDAAQEMIAKRLKSLPITQTISFLRLMEVIFKKGKWRAGYGGERWGAIAGTVADYLRGKLPADLFVDRVFDLRHNGGILFDKHEMVKRRSCENCLQSQLQKKKENTGDPADLLRKLFTEHNTKLSNEVAVVYDAWAAQAGRSAVARLR